MTTSWIVKGVDPQGEIVQREVRGEGSAVAVRNHWRSLGYGEITYVKVPSKKYSPITLHNAKIETLRRLASQHGMQGAYKGPKKADLIDVLCTVVE